MGFEDLASELRKQAEAEGRKLLHAAERSAGKIGEAAGEKSESALHAAKKEAASFVKQESSERLTSTKLSAKKILDGARDEAVEAGLRQVWQQFRSESLKKSIYPQLLNRLVSEGLSELGTTDAVAYVRDEDRSLVSGYRLARLPPGFSGGAILESANGRVKVNRTLEEVFSQKSPSLRKEIYDKMF